MKSSLLAAPHADNTSLELAPVVPLDEGQNAPIQQWPENPGPMPAKPEGLPVHITDLDGNHIKTNYVYDPREAYVRTFNELDIDGPRASIPVEQWSADDIIEALPDNEQDNTFIRSAREGGFIPSPMDSYVHSHIYRPVEESDLGQRVELSNDAKDWHTRTLDKIKIRQGAKPYYRVACFTRCESRQTVDENGNPTTEPVKFKHWQYARVYCGKGSPTGTINDRKVPSEINTADIGIYRENMPTRNLTAGEVESLLVDHAAWIPSHEGKRLAPTRCRIEGLDLSGKDFTQAFFKDSVFTNCNLTGCDFGGVFTDHLHFHECELAGASFSSGSLSQVSFGDCNLRNANFCDADLHDGYFRDCDLRESIMSRADLHGVSFHEVNLAKAIGLPKIQSLPNLAGMLHTGLTLAPDRMAVAYGHFPDRLTIAEWVCMLHPQGELLETLLDSDTAAALIWNATYGECPTLDSDDPKSALDWLRIKAYAQCRFRVCKIDDQGAMLSPVFDTDWLPDAEEMIEDLKQDDIAAGVFCIQTGCRVVDGKLRDDLPGNGKPLSPWIKAAQLDL